VTRRVVITGLGAVTCFGAGAPALWQGVRNGRAGATARTFPDRTHAVVCAVGDWLAPDELFGRRDARRMDRVGHLAACAAGLALEDAGALGLAPELIGAAVGCTHGGVATLESAAEAHASRGPDRVSALSIPLGLPNAAVTAAARTHRLKGPALAPASACAAGADAIGLAAEVVASGRAVAMVAGGAEAPLGQIVVAGYRQSGALSGATEPAQASRPFDVRRDGFVIAEGAGLLVLEEREHARARRARVYGEVVGYGASCDAAHLTDPEPDGDGPARAIAAALSAAGAEPGDVGYVNAHATSTPAGDVAEARALARAGLAATPVSSTKGSHGHALGAAGGIEAVVTAMAIAEGVLPPTANLDEPDPDAPTGVLSEARDVPGLRLALSDSFGFGGQNACLAIAAPDR
jgi:3-oxoacyl-[acyl-carrier-protein] synthase II